MIKAGRIKETLTEGKKGPVRFVESSVPNILLSYQLLSSIFTRDTAVNFYLRITFGILTRCSIDLLSVVLGYSGENEGAAESSAFTVCHWEVSNLLLSLFS
jgi:hypothetical protein